MERHAFYVAMDSTVSILGILLSVGAGLMFQFGIFLPMALLLGVWIAVCLSGIIFLLSDREPIDLPLYQQELNFGQNMVPTFS
ncbi:MAG TPA: hypothetical protein DCE41_08985 [Cytophagales bacterium]|nr:hypothetical protein [Cytophagales bacterium]HAA21324.1 hypothetical protein [Cytophagales bacterium]HAP58376.1 hypothetical protein [Cytophagales bacterium]